MARWRLMAAHYINVPGSEWEYKETDRNTGRQARVIAPVPRLLEPKDPSDHNYPGEIIVTDGHNGQRRDYVFTGPPTPDMEPIDEEAEKITKDIEATGAWTKPSEGEVYGENLLLKLMAQLDAASRNAPAPLAPAVSEGQVDAKAFKALQEQVAALMDANIKLQAQVAGEPATGDLVEGEVIAPPPPNKPQQFARRL